MGSITRTLDKMYEKNSEQKNPDKVVDTQITNNKIKDEISNIEEKNEEQKNTTKNNKFSNIAKDNKKEILTFLKELYNFSRLEIDTEVLKLNEIQELKNYTRESIEFGFPAKLTLEYIGKMISFEEE